jgi:hypothetical protein
MVMESICAFLYEADIKDWNSPILLIPPPHPKKHPKRGFYWLFTQLVA